MKLNIFLDKKELLTTNEEKEIADISKGNLYDQLSEEEKEKIYEDEESFLGGVYVETTIKNGDKNPIIFNYYKITKTPTIIFSNEDEVIYRWENVPTLSEITKSMVSYFRILKLNSLDYNYDPEE